MKRLLWFGAVAIALAGCTIRLGGPLPVEYRTVGWQIPAGMTPGEAAAFLLGERVQVALLVTESSDSSWYYQVAAATGRRVSGPARIGSSYIGFLTEGEAVGDTTVVLPVDGGGEVIAHDALYEVDDTRFLNLLAVQIPPGANVRESVRALLRYIATDVMIASTVVLAVAVPNEAVGEEVTALLAPHLMDVAECDSRAAPEASEGGQVRLYFGPEARARCADARRLDAPNGPVLIRVIVPR